MKTLITTEIQWRVGHSLGLAFSITIPGSTYLYPSESGINTESIKHCEKIYAERLYSSPRVQSPLQVQCSTKSISYPYSQLIANRIWLHQQIYTKK